MKYFGRAEQAASHIVDAFKSGNLPKALAPIFIRRKDGVPCRAWSWGDQLLCNLYGTQDARGFKLWNNVGRKVKKVSKCFITLVPRFRTVTMKDPSTGEDRNFNCSMDLEQRRFFLLNAPREQNCRRLTKT